MGFEQTDQSVAGGLMDWSAGKKADFDAMGRHILSENGPRCIRLPIKARNEDEPGYLHCLARHQDCAAILRDEETFDLRLYDASFEELGDDLYALLGAHSEDRERRMNMLLSATQIIGETADAQGGKEAAAEDETAGPQGHAALLTRVEQVSRAHAKKILQIIYREHHRGPQSETRFNAVREYMYMVTYQSVREIIGLPLPEKMSKTVRLLTFFRNLKSVFFERLQRFAPTGDLAASTNMHLWLLVINAQVVGYGSGKNAPLSFFARDAMKHFLSAVEQVLDRPELIAPGSLAEALFDADVRKKFAELDEDQYRIQARNIIIELIVAMGGLMPLAMVNIMDFIFGPEAAAAGTSSHSILAALENPENANAVLNEALRLQPPAVRLFRRVTKNVELGDVKLTKGDWIALLMSAATRDETTFSQPHFFRADRRGDYLEFGLDGGAHSCFGQHIARTIIRVMIQELKDAAEPVFAPEEKGMHRFLGAIPDDMAWRFLPTYQPGYNQN